MKFVGSHSGMPLGLNLCNASRQSHDRLESLGPDKSGSLVFETRETSCFSKSELRTHSSVAGIEVSCVSQSRRWRFSFLL